MNTKGNGNNKKFLQETAPLSLEAVMQTNPCKKKQLHYIADPHIEPYKEKGYTYYRYRRGIDPPVHLGSAQFVLEAVTNYREIIRKRSTK